MCDLSTYWYLYLQILMNETHGYAISHTDICLYCFVAYVSFLYAYILSEKKRRLLWQFLLNYFCWVSDFPWMPLQFPVCKGLGMRKLNKKTGRYYRIVFWEDFRHLCRSSAGFLAASSRSTSPVLTTGSALSFLVSSRQNDN